MMAVIVDVIVTSLVAVHDLRLTVALAWARNIWLLEHLQVILTQDPTKL